MSSAQAAGGMAAFIVVLREGLEAVCVLAAVSAALVRGGRAERRLVLGGGVLGVLACTGVWLGVGAALGDGGVALQAWTALPAIALLLLITNWFFHRIYWTGWIARLGRGRRAVSARPAGAARTLGFLGLGFVAAAREGLETVLFVAPLRAGGSAVGAGVAVGAALGLLVVLGVAAYGLVLRRKLPYKRLLIVTGMAVVLVLAQTVGAAVHDLQALGVLPTSALRYAAPAWAATWLGLHATWEGLVLQLAAVGVMLGSYAVAREVRVHGPQRRARRVAQTA
jgi:high-affinity iron transporter